MSLVDTIVFMFSFLPSSIRTFVISIFCSVLVFGLFHLIIFIKKLFLFG